MWCVRSHVVCTRCCPSTTAGATTSHPISVVISVDCGLSHGSKQCGGRPSTAIQAAGWRGVPAPQVILWGHKVAAATNPGQNLRYLIRQTSPTQRSSFVSTHTACSLTLTLQAPWPGPPSSSSPRRSCCSAAATLLECRLRWTEVGPGHPGGQGALGRQLQLRNWYKHAAAALLWATVECNSLGRHNLDLSSSWRYSRWSGQAITSSTRFHAPPQTRAAP